MNGTRLRFSACGLAALSAAIATSGAYAIPLTFTVQPTSIGTPATFSGTLSGDFDPFDRTFTITSGSITSTAYAGSGAVAPTTVFDGGTIIGNVVVTASGNATFSVPAVSMTNISGVVTDGGTAIGLTGVGVGGASFLSGDATLEVDSFLFDDTSTVTFSAELAATPFFGGLVELANAGSGSRLELPFGVSTSVTTLDLDASGLASVLGPVQSILEPLVVPTFENALDSALSLPTSITATSATPLPDLPVNVSYAIDPTQSFLASGSVSTPIAGTMVGRYFDGTLDLSGGNVIEASFVGGPVNGITGSAPGLSWDFDLSSASLDVGFDLLEGRIGNTPRPLDGLGVQGSFTASGSGNFVLDLLGGPLAFNDITFSLRSDFDFTTDIDTGVTTLIRTLELETLTIPFSADLGVIGFSNADIDIDSTNPLGLFGDLFLETLATFFAPRLQEIAFSTLPPPTFDGLIVATRPLTAPPAQVPEPPTWLLAALGFALLAASRPLRARARATR